MHFFTLRLCASAVKNSPFPRFLRIEEQVCHLHDSGGYRGGMEGVENLGDCADEDTA